MNPKSRTGPVEAWRRLSVNWWAGLSWRHSFCLEPVPQLLFTLHLPKSYTSSDITPRVSKNKTKSRGDYVCVQVCLYSISIDLWIYACMYVWMNVCVHVCNIYIWISLFHEIVSCIIKLTIPKSIGQADRLETQVGVDVVVLKQSFFFGNSFCPWGLQLLGMAHPHYWGEAPSLRVNYW